MTAKRVLAALLCLCMMVPAIGLQLVNPITATAADATEQKHIVAEFNCFVSGVKTAGTANLMPGVAWTLAEPLDLTQYGYSTDAEENTLALQMDMYVAGDEGLMNALCSGGVSGQIELTSAGTCDNQEVYISPSVVKFQPNTWVRRQIPLSSIKNASGEEAFDPTAFNYFRLYYAAPPSSLSGQQVTMKICNIRLVNTAVPAPSIIEDPLGDGTFAPKEAPTWEKVEIPEGFDDSTTFVAGYNLVDYIEEYEVDLVNRHGQIDYAPVINSLLEGLDAAGGGTLYIPSGHYSCYGSIRIPRGVSICGDWRSPEEDAAVDGTVIEVYASHNQANGPQFMMMSTHTQVRNLTFWYPKQDAEHVVPYPATILTNHYTFVENVTFVNSYFAVQQNSAANCPNVWNVFGTPLNRGLDIDSVIDIARLEEIHFAPDYWIESGLPGAPSSPMAEAALRKYLYENGIAVTLRRIDWSYFTYSDIRGYHTGLCFDKCIYSESVPNGQCVGLYFKDCYNALMAYNVSGSCESFLDVKIENCVNGLFFSTGRTFSGSYGMLQVSNIDIDATGAAVLMNNNCRVSILSSTIRQGAVIVNDGFLMMGETQFNTPAPHVVLNAGADVAILLGNKNATGGEITYLNRAGCPVSYNAAALNLKGYTHLSVEEAAPKVMGPAKDTVYVAEGLDNTGKTDVTEKLQTYLTTAGTNGGGLVFLPPGRYLVNGALNVPTGVELRGAGDFGTIPAPVNTIICVTRQGDEDDDATVTLQEAAGIRGVTFHYPEQYSVLTETTVNDVQTYDFTFYSYPYAIRGAGADVYVTHVTAHNGWNGVDLKTNRCDNHYVDYLAGHFFNRGIVVGGGSENGVIRNYQFNYNAILNPNNDIWGNWGVEPGKSGVHDHFHLAMQRQFNNNSIILQIGDVKDLLVYNCFNYASYIGVHFVEENGNEPNGVRLYGHGVDYGTVSVQVEAGTGIELVNTQLTAFNQAGSGVTGEYAVTDKNLYDIWLTSTFDDEITVTNFTEWAPSPTAGLRVDNGTLNIYNAALNHTSSQFIEMNSTSKGKVNLVCLSSGRADDPVLVRYENRNQVKVTGGFYNAAFKLLRTYGSGSYAWESKVSTTNVSYAHKWTAYSATDNYSAFSYTTNSTGLTITGYSGSDTVVAVPEAIGGTPVTAIAASVFAGKSVKAVWLPYSITAIPDGLFSGCTALTDVSMGGAVTSIGANAFEGCTALATFYLPESVTSVAANAFSGCTALTKVVYGGSHAERNGIAIVSGNEPLTAATWEYRDCAHADTTVKGYVAPAAHEAGRTGITVCNNCGETVARSRLISPLGYVYFDTAGGTLTSNVAVAEHQGNSKDVVAIGDTGEYGIQLKADWSGVRVTGALFKDVPADQSVTMAIEYYMDTAISGNQQMFRVVPHDGAAQKDFYIYNDALRAGESSLVFYTFTAEQRALLGTDNFNFYVLGCTPGANHVYIQSIKLVPTSAVYSGINLGYAYADFTEDTLCDYYTDVFGYRGYNTAQINAETSANHPDAEYLYRYLKVYGTALSSTATANKPVFLRVYTTAGYENTTIDLNAYEVSNGTKTGFSNVLGFPTATITVNNGVGTLLLNESCFRNGLNNIGSLRVWYADVPKIARIEIYDAAKACEEPNAPAEVTAYLHQWMLDNNQNLVVEGATAPTIGAAGQEDDTRCATCGKVLIAGEVLLPTEYAWMDTAGGKLTTNRVLGAQGDSGSTAVSAIGSTGEYGIKLSADWSGFWLGGKMFEAVPEGRSVTMLIEYYIDAAYTTNEQLFRFRPYADAEHTDVFIDSHNLVTQKSGLVYHTFTAEEMAAIGTGDFRFEVMGCTPGAGNVYIQSMKLVNTEYVYQKEDLACSYVDFIPSLVSEYYPDITVAYSFDAGYQDAETSPTYPDAEYIYRYVRVEGDAHSSLLTKNKPVYVKVYGAEGYENTTLNINAFEVSNGSTTGFSGNYGYPAPQVVIKNGVGGLFMNATCFANRLNSLGALRFFYTEVEKIRRIEIYDATTYCLDPQATEEMKAELHTALRRNTAYIVAKDMIEPTCSELGYEAGRQCTLCGDYVTGGAEIAMLPHTEVEDPAVAPACNKTGLTAGSHCEVCGVVIVEQTVVNKVGHKVSTVKGYAATCTEPGLTDGKSCSMCGMTVVKQKTIAATGHTEVIDSAIEPTCDVEGYTEGSHCSVCDEILVRQEEIAPLGHVEVIDEGYDALCTSDGLTEGSHCDRCGEILVAQEIIPAAGSHTWDEGVVEKEPTATEEGLRVYMCEVCGENKEESIPALACTHKNTTVIAKENATCTAAGYTGDTVCLDCDSIVKEGSTIAKLPHTWDDGVVTTPPTTEATGIKTFTCTVCGATKTEELPVLGKEYTYTITDGAVTITKVATSISGDVVIPDTIEGYPVTAIAANAFKGCVNMTSVTIPASITSIDYYAFRNCTALATVYYNAANCTKVGVASMLAFNGCTALTTLYVGKEVTQIPANAFRGVATLTTLYMTKNTKVINASAFHQTALLDVYYVGMASDWANVDVKSFNTIFDTAVFSYNYPCFQDHEWTADCDSLCDLCNLKRVTTHANLVDDAAVEPTCDTSGLTAGSHCSVCGNVITAQRYIPALGHTWDAGEVLVAPTEEANGSKLYTCTVCGGTKTVVLTMAEIIDGKYYVKGILTPDAGLVMVEDAYYYVSSGGNVRTGRYMVSNVNEFAFEKGIYYFHEDGKMNTVAAVYEGYYFNENGKLTAYAGLVEVEGSKYYVNDGGKVNAGGYFYISRLNGLLPKSCFRTFYPDGRMLEETRIYDVDGYYYENGVRTPYAGMVEYEGHWYYVNDGGAYMKNKVQVLVNVNNSGIAKSRRCYFDAEGHMVYNTVVNGAFFGADGAAPDYAGVVKDNEGNLYYVNGVHGAVRKNATFNITTAKANGLCAAGRYTADATGKLSPA